MRARAIPPEQTQGFEIVASEVTGKRRVSIPADLATCPECLGELRDPRDRRYRYAFTNCTHCGPRYTIARDVPYDRPATTMAGFVMCARLPARVRGSRRQTLPRPADRLSGVRPAAAAAGARSMAPRRPTEAASAPAPSRGSDRRRRRGAARAGGSWRSRAWAGTTSPATRARPPPCAVSASASAATRSRSRSWCATSRPRASWLRSRRTKSGCSSSVERPIVLVRRRPDAALAPEVAPGNPLVGILLAYTPLHDLLLEAFAGPLVMTSGNLSEEPMAAEDGEARERLGRDRRPLPDARPRDREPLRRLGGAGDRGPADAAAPLARLRAPADPAAAAGRATHPRLRRAAQERVLPGSGRRGLAGTAHRRPRQPRGRARLRGAGRAPAALPRHPPRGDRPRPASGLRLHRLRAAPPGADQDRGPASPRARGERAGRARARRAGARPGLGRHGLRHGRHGLGRRAAAGRGRLASSGSRRCGRSVSPAATRRSARSGGSRSPPWTTPSTGRRRSSGCGSSTPSRTATRAVVRQMLAKGLQRPARARRGPLLRRDRGARPGATACELRGAGRARMEPGPGRRARPAATRSSCRRASACPQADLRPLVRAAAQDVAGGVAAAVVSARFHNAMADVAVALVRHAAGGRAQLPRRAHGRLLPERGAGRAHRAPAREASLRQESALGSPSAGVPAGRRAA